MNFNPIEDLSPLGYLTNLEVLQIEKCKETDYDFLSNLTNLKILYMGITDSVSNLDFLQNLTELEDFSLGALASDNKLDISNVFKLSKLKRLQLSGLPWLTENELQEMYKLENLENLLLMSDNIKDINFLKTLNLKCLYIGNNLMIVDESYNAGNNHITDFSPISNMTSLTEINISNLKGVYDLNAFSNLKNLTCLWLENGELRDATALDKEELNKVEFWSNLWLYYNHIEDEIETKDNEEIILEVPLIIQQAMDENSLLYSTEGVSLSGCEWVEKGKTVKVEQTEYPYVYISVASGYAAHTSWYVNISNNESHNKIVKSIQIEEEPTNKVFTQGDEIKFTDGTLTIIYSDDTEAEVFLQDPRITISNYNSYMLGEQTITINFEGASTELTITVIEEEEISSIQISTEPNAIEYKEGEGLDLTGGKLLVKYKDDSEKEISLLDFRIKISNYNPNMLGEQTVTINFKGATTELTITVIGTEKEISSIQVSTEPNKIEYKKGEELDLAGGKLLVKYQDETEEEIDLTTEGITFSNYNPDSIGKQPIYIHYKGKMTGLWIEVVENNNQETDNNYWKFLPYLIARDSENGYLENIEQGTTCKDIIDVAYTNGRIEIYKDDKLVEDLNEKLATGMIVKVIFTNEEYSYKVVVAGDINGDAEVDELDLLMLARYNAGYEKETQMVVNEYLRATNVYKDEDFGDVLDLLKLARMLVNLD